MSRFGLPGLRQGRLERISLRHHSILQIRLRRVYFLNRVGASRAIAWLGSAAGFGQTVLGYVAFFSTVEAGERSSWEGFFGTSS